MEPSPSPESPRGPVSGTAADAPLGDAEVDALFALADRSLRAGLAGGPRPEIDPARLAPALLEKRGAFVTLEVDGRLNGCIGTLEAVEPLGGAVARLAWEAAFNDPRLPPLEPADYPAVEFKVSLIGALEALPATSEEELAAGLRPGADGLVIRAGTTQATFLPAVWRILADPLVFVRHLESKARLAPGEWPPGLQAWRYRATEYRRRAVDAGRGSSAAA